MEERQVGLVDPDRVEISRRESLERDGLIGPGVIVRLEGANEVIPVCRIIDNRAEAIAPLGQEVLETASALRGAFVRDRLEPALRKKSDDGQGADKDQDEKNQKE